MASSCCHWTQRLSPFFHFLFYFLSKNKTGLYYCWIRLEKYSTLSATAMLDWNYVINLPSSLCFCCFRWAGQSAEENLHKMGQQASHQGMFHWAQLVRGLALKCLSGILRVIYLNTEFLGLHLNSYCNRNTFFEYNHNLTSLLTLSSASALSVSLHKSVSIISISLSYEPVM